MVTVSILRRPDIDTTVLRPLINAMPTILTRTLEIPTEDIAAITTQEFQIFDLSRFSLFIDIVAANHPTYRAGHHKGMCEIITQAIRQNLPEKLIGQNKVCVRIFFAPMSSKII